MPARQQAVDVGRNYKLQIVQQNKTHVSFFDNYRQDTNDNYMMSIQKESLSDKAIRLKQKYVLTDCGFDAECIHQSGDLSNLIKSTLTRLLPAESFEINETTFQDSKQFMSTIIYKGQKLLDIFADTYADFLPDNFTDLFESIPDLMKIDKRFCLINPRLTGQAMWYFCGTDQNLRQSKLEGLPIILPGDDVFDSDVSDYE